MQSIQLETFEIDGLRTRLRKMFDVKHPSMPSPQFRPVVPPFYEELRKFGKAARYMVSPRANMGKPPLPAFVLQLEESRAEWRRRYPPPVNRRTQGITTLVD
jgi:hypothetical protein